MQSDSMLCILFYISKKQLEILIFCNNYYNTLNIKNLYNILKESIFLVRLIYMNYEKEFYLGKLISPKAYNKLEFT